MSLAQAQRIRPHSCNACPLHRSFCDFPEELRIAFDGLKTTIAYHKNEAIFDEGMHCHSVFAICEGHAKLVTTSREGRILLLRVAGPGEMLGLAEAVLDAPYETSAIALESSILAVIPRETFIRFISSYPEACVKLTVALSEQYRFAQREEKFLGFGEPSIVRLAHRLLEWAAERGVLAEDGVYIPLHLSHSDLAHAIGATRETVTRILGNLSDDGLIERRADGIVILRHEELAHFGMPKVTSEGDADATGAAAGDVSILEEPMAPGGVP
jgi:CRP/FNR family cyclic AMP-dependent transcriptional regulator